MTDPRKGSHLDRLNELLALASAGASFQRERIGDLRLETLDDLAKLPLTTKDELLADQAANPPFGTNLCYALERYTHLHQTSGTTGATLRVVDTPEDWAWFRDRFGMTFRAAGMSAGDRVAMAHSFGPYIQFWASYEGVQSVGAMVIPMGGMDSVQRLHTLRDFEATALLCTPSYAVHLAKVAVENDLTDATSSVERVICTGEPGASLPAVKERIETSWEARCFDHAGLAEVGAFADPCTEGGLHLAEDDFLCEILDPQSHARVTDGQLGELVITSLSRTGFPVIRYRTGDVVEAHGQACPAGHEGSWLPQGILGRTDDMVVIRGMNVFPSAIEQILREAGGVGEFRITFYNDPRAMDEVKLEAELAHPGDARTIQARMRQRLGLRVRIVPLKAGILPPQIGKARRVEDLRPGAAPAWKRGGAANGR